MDLSSEDGEEQPSPLSPTEENENNESEDEDMVGEVDKAEKPELKQPIKPADQSLDEDGQTCTICFEPWTNYSEHRLVSLRCGHLFGRSCISRWLHSQHARCPQCNARARKSEIRNIYAKSIKVLDCTERDQAREALRRENELRCKAEFQVSQESLKVLMARQECERLKTELMEVNKLLAEYRSGARKNESSQSSKPQSMFLLEKSLELVKKGGCRLLDISNLLGMIIASQPSPNDLFQGYGFRKVSIEDMKPTEFVLVHQKVIKDMAFHESDGLVITASLDRTVKITNVITNSVVQTYSTPCESWSCAWDVENPLYFYAGLRTGEVLLFDIRFTRNSVCELPAFGSKTPAVAIQYLSKNSASKYGKAGPVVGKLSDCAFYEKLENVGSYKVLPLPSLGTFTSLSSEPISGHFLLSCRPSLKQPRVSHTVCEVTYDAATDNIVCNPMQTILGGRTQVQISRAKLMVHPEDAHSLLVCAGDEDAKGTMIWDCSSGANVDRLPTESPVLDLANIKINHQTHLLSLTDKNLRLYSWKS